MLENASQTIAGNFPASQEFWNTPSQMCSIAACGWAFRQIDGNLQGSHALVKVYSIVINSFHQNRLKLGCNLKDIYESSVYLHVYENMNQGSQTLKNGLFMSVHG